MRSNKKEIQKETVVDPRKIKEDYSVSHEVKEEKLKFGDTSDKVEVHIPELQMSFFVSKNATPEDIERKKQSYLNRSGAYLVFKAREI